MATRTTVILTCDLDHEVETDADSGPVVFSIDGHAYELDLCEEHAVQVRETFQQVASYARKPSRQSAASAGGPVSRRESRRESRAARDYLRAHPEVIDGQLVSERGRVAEAHLAAWRAKGRPGFIRG